MTFRYIAFAGDYYLDRVSGGGWYGAVGGGDNLEELAQAALETAQARLDDCTAPVGSLVIAWAHVVDLEKCEIVWEKELSAYGGPNRLKINNH